MRRDLADDSGVCRTLSRSALGAAIVLSVAVAGCSSERPESIAQTRLAATFPAESGWTAVPQAGAGFADPLIDGQNNGREIVGTTASPAVYTAVNGSDFFVRLRVDLDPAQGDSVRPFGWGLLIDTN